MKQTLATLVFGLLVLQSLPGATGTLRPPMSSPSRETALPFFQAVPFAKGELAPAEHFTVNLGEKEIPSVARPLVYWSDGSVRWLGVNGLWPSEAPVAPTVVTFGKKARKAPARALSLGKNKAGNALVLTGSDGNTIATLFPAASLLPIDLPKEPQPSDSDYGDREGQYSWAQPINKLSADPKIEPLSPRILKSVTEEENSLYTVQVFQGDFGPKAPGRQLEWQFREIGRAHV